MRLAKRLVNALLPGPLKLCLHDGEVVTRLETSYSRGSFGPYSDTHAVAACAICGARLGSRKIY